MNKQTIFNEIIDNLLNSVKMNVNSGEFTSNKDAILLNNRPITYVPYEYENESIHGRIRASLAKEFVNTYTFNDIKKMLIEKIAKTNTHLASEENNRSKLDELFNSIYPIISKYNKANSEVEFNHSNNKYYIEFSCSVDNMHRETIIILNSDDYNNFLFRYNYNNEILTAMEIIERVKALSINYEKYHIEVTEKNRIEAEEIAKKEKLQSAIYNLYTSKTPIILKNKNSYILYHKGVRFAVGDGKSGKFMKCNYSQFGELITKKGINEYAIAEDKMYSTSELKELEYKNILVIESSLEVTNNNDNTIEDQPIIENQNNSIEEITPVIDHVTKQKESIEITPASSQVTNNNIIYQVETRSGGSIIKNFTNKIEAMNYYNENKKYNVVYRELISIGQYYYSEGNNCIALYNSNYNWLCTVKNTENNITEEYIKESLNNYFSSYVPEFNEEIEITNNNINNNEIAMSSEPIPAVTELKNHIGINQEILLKAYNLYKEDKLNIHDVYEDNGCQKIVKGINYSGDQYYGYEYQPSLFEKSDLTGKKVRFYIEIEGYKFHPDELKKEIKLQVQKRKIMNSRIEQLKNKQYEILENITMSDTMDIFEEVDKYALDKKCCLIREIIIEKLLNINEEACNNWFDSEENSPRRFFIKE